MKTQERACPPHVGAQKVATGHHFPVGSRSEQNGFNVLECYDFAQRTNLRTPRYFSFRTFNTHSGPHDHPAMVGEMEIQHVY